MISIIKANPGHAKLLSEIAKRTFIESHGSSAKPGDVDAYVAKNYNEEVLKNELLDQANIYHILYYNNQAAGYSKLILDAPYENSTIKNIAKFERLYLLKEFYNTGLGLKLFEFNLSLVKENEQTGIWLFVWKENKRAVSFYKKNGFTITGSYDFKISEDHSNPNHQMFFDLR